MDFLETCVANEIVHNNHLTNTTQLKRGYYLCKEIA